MFQPIIDQMFLDKYENREPDGKWHPSGLTGCERQAVYTFTGTPQSDEKQVRSIRIMGRGTQMHEEIQAAILKAHPGFLSEVDIDFRSIKGSCDGLLPTGDGVSNDPDSAALEAVYELQEFKSISPLGKQYLKGPRAEHAKQARIYYGCLQEQGWLLDGIRLSYFDRDDYSVREYEVEPWAQNQFDDFLDSILVLNDHVDWGTLPPQMPKSYWLCKYCEYATRCRGEDDDR